MTTFEVVACVVLLILFPVVAYGVNAAYHNGVTDGYGYSREPSCPGYARAGAYLRKYMAHRWRELRVESKPKDWRIGRPVMGKYMHNVLIYHKPGTVSEVLPSGYMGINDPNGVLVVSYGACTYVVAGADAFVTA